ncbi:DEAD/DEAH box helicase [Lewinella sp. LCG006]|uniref:DEAD/DEAH box helicase n=1 Tax=Lewinella sp. LCG006 TaxID=3231911 RepID=UPI00345F9B06
MKFSDYPLSPEIKKNIEALAYKRPTDIQFKAIPLILKGADVLAVAQTGTGKTAAFAIPVLQKLQSLKERQRRKDGIKCLVMVPTRELALQITKVFEELGKHTGVKTYGLLGGVEQDPQIATLIKGVDVLITTPGRMFDLSHQGALRLERVEILIIDEADQMLGLGFLKDVRDVMRLLPKRRQTLFFSATIDEDIKSLAHSLTQQAIRIQISPKDPVSKNVDHSVLFVEMDDKRFFLERILKENPDGKMLVFVRTKVRAERVQKAMERVGISSLILHGDVEQSERTATLAAFNADEERLLIATDVSARGIDISNITHVINYDLPTEADQYVHRIGRTGRAKQRGIAYAFCAPEEKELLRAIHAYTGYEIRILDLDRADYRETLKMAEEDQYGIKELLQATEETLALNKKGKSKRRKGKKH